MSDARQNEGAPAAGAPNLSGTAASEASVQFINGEVLSPGPIEAVTFMHPYRAQVASMAMDDARNYVQGVEQVLLVATAKFLAAENANGLALVLQVMNSLPPYLTQIATAVPSSDQ